MRFDLLRDRVKVRPFAGFKFGVNEFTIDANFKGTAAGRDQPGIHARRFLNESGQTGRFRFVVSVGAVLDRYFWLHARLPYRFNIFVRDSSVEAATLAFEVFACGNLRRRARNRIVHGGFNDRRNTLRDCAA